MSAGRRCAAPTATASLATYRPALSRTWTRLGTAPPSSLLAVGEVRAAGRFSALPAAIARRSARNSGSPPWGVWRHQIASTAIASTFTSRRRLLHRRDDLRNAAVLAPADDLQRLVVVKRRDRLAQPDGDITGIHHTGQALDQRRQLNEPLGPRSRRRTGAGQPRTDRAGGSTRRASDVRSPSWPTSLTKAASRANGEVAAADRAMHHL